MSLALIQESAKEARRLAIAGSPLAVGDFRLKKFIVPLEQAGAKVPVFAQVAKAISDLVNGNETDSAANLLNLSTLLNAILYTQGQSGADGDFCDLETFPTNCSSTRTPARVLKPLVQALTSTGGGRFEVIKSAWERGAFNDLRLIDPAIQALGDNYPELADLVAQKILPACGSGIVPRLKSTLDLNGRKEHARRLSLIHQLDPAGTLELCKTALEAGSPEVKAAAIACLGQHPECLSLVMEQANGKNKMLRAAALEALASHEQPEITKLFTELISGKTLDILASPLRRIRNWQVLNSLLSEGRRVFDLLLKGDSEQVPRLWEILDCLEGRKDDKSEDFLLSCLNHCEKLGRIKAAKGASVSVADFTTRLASLLCNIGSPKAIEGLLARREALPLEAFDYVFRSALAAWPPGKVYQEFAPLLEQKNQADKSKVEQILRTIPALSGVNLFDGDNLVAVQTDSAEGPSGQKPEWDPRWVDAAIKADQSVLVCCFAKPGDKGAVSYLLKLAEAQTQTTSGAVILRGGQTGMVFRTLVRCQYPKVTDVFLNLVARKTKNAQHVDYELQMLLQCARFLPAADLPRLDEFAARLEEKFVDHYLNALAPLRASTQPN